MTESGRALDSRALRRAMLRSAPLAACLVALSACGHEPPAPLSVQTVSVEVEALDLVDVFEAGGPGLRVIEQDRDQPLQAVPAAALDRGTQLASDRDDLVIAARAESAFEIRAGPFLRGAKLRARTMVYSQFRTDEDQVDPAPVVFRVLVDGKERVALSSDYTRDVEGHSHPYDQLMRTLEVELGDTGGKPVTLRFETTRNGAAIPEGAIPAEPAWWELVVVQPVDIERQPVTPARPNLLVLAVDTLAAKRMSLHGYARDTTPNLKAFAASGRVYEAASTPSSWTLPSTASLLTGLPPNTHGVLGDTRSYLMDGLQTWPELLRSVGIEGAAFVSNPLIAEANNFDQGFGRWLQANDSQGTSVRAAELNEHLLAWIDGQPPAMRWFAYVHYMDPHAPYDAPGDERNRYAGSYAERRDFGGTLPSRLQRGEIPPFTPDEQQHVIDLYDAELAYFDRCFGNLLDELGSRGLRETTTIVLTADHGEELFEHGRLGHGYSLYDELLWVPLVLAGPGIAAGERRSAPVSTAAVAATLAAWGGAEPVAGMEPPLEGPAPKPERPAGEPIVSAVRTSLFVPDGAPMRNLVAARDGQGRKVIVDLDEAGAASAVERFNLAADPGERAPLDEGTLSASERTAYERLVQRAVAWARETAERRLPEPQPNNPQIDEALRANGYVGGRKP